MASHAQPRARARVVYVDLLRLAAIFQMVQGHTLDAVLDPSYRVYAAHAGWTWTRGLTSIAFLFAAGLSFHLAVLSRTDTREGDAARRKRRILRAIMLVGLGYLLRNPIAGLFGSAQAFDAAWHAFLAVDILQCIGVSLLMLETLVLVVRRPSRVAWASAVLFLLATVVAPFAARWTAAPGWSFAINYFTTRDGSLFPLVPFAGYLFAGVAAGALVLPQGAATPRQTTTVRLALVGAGLLVVGLLTPEVAAPIDQIATKLGSVALFAAVIALASLRLSRLSFPWDALASESLVIYVVHVVLLYGAGFGLQTVIGRDLSLLSALLLVVVMLLISAAVAIVFHKKKVNLRGQAQQTFAIQ